MRKSILLVATSWLCAFAAHAGPNDTTNGALPVVLKSESVWKDNSVGIQGKFMLTAGIGFNAVSDVTSINYIQSKFWNDSLAGKAWQGLAVNTFSQSPFYNLMLDYGLTDNISAGIGLGYQTMSIQWGTTNIFFTDNWTRFAPSLRADYHFVAKKKMSLYAGGRLGYNFYSLSSDFSAYHPAYSKNFDGGPSKGIAQIHGGFSYFIKGFIGINAELGYSYGENYYAGIGLTFKF